MSTLADSPIIRMDGVTKTYVAGSVEIPALRHINLEMWPDRFTMVIGPSGSGKTTLLNIIGCIDGPTTGRVEIGSQDIAALTDDSLSDFRAARIGFIFQSFNLMPVLTAYENVEYPLLLVGMRAPERRERVMAMLDAVGLASQAGQRPNELSGGQKQRVAIARALVKRPQLVLADEPTANLDTQTGHSVIELMRRIQAESRTTFVFSTHDPQLISHADETFTIRDGEIVDHNAGKVR
jgi:putative ABC transport system ATP-binding protein